ncbi:MAG: hypothetical protein ACREQ4_03510 [Candidatus Binataceae bacterium]
MYEAVRRGDMAAYHALRAQDSAINEALAEIATFCGFCGGLMLHAAAGIYYCPYERAGRHEFARRAISEIAIVITRAHKAGVEHD